MIRLTEREKQVCELLVEGCNNRQIAERMGIAERTIKQYVQNLCWKFQIRSGCKRILLALAFFRQNRIVMDPESSPGGNENMPGLCGLA